VFWKRMIQRKESGPEYESEEYSDDEEKENTSRSGKNTKGSKVVTKAVVRTSNGQKNRKIHR
jgi:hypothetical protein